MNKTLCTLLAFAFITPVPAATAQSPVLDIDTVLPGGVTPEMTMAEAEARLLELGAELRPGMGTKHFYITTGLPDEITMPNGSILTASNSNHYIMLAPEYGDRTKIRTVTASLFADTTCYARLESAYGAPQAPCDKASFDRGNACSWTAPDGSYSVSGNAHGPYGCAIRFNAS